MRHVAVLLAGGFLSSHGRQSAIGIQLEWRNTRRYLRVFSARSKKSPVEPYLARKPTEDLRIADVSPAAKDRLLKWKLRQVQDGPTKSESAPIGRGTTMEVAC